MPSRRSGKAGAELLVLRIAYALPGADSALFIQHVARGVPYRERPSQPCSPASAHPACSHIIMTTLRPSVRIACDRCACDDAGRPIHGSYYGSAAAL
jgi:hypothetical protein